MKEAKAAVIAATYADNAVDCPATGDCIKGRPAIEQHLRERSAKFGKAVSASVTSMGSVQQGGFVYEWGRPEATFGDAKQGGGPLPDGVAAAADGRVEDLPNMAMPADHQ